MENEGQGHEEREPTLEELGLHSHCLNCILKRCNVSAEPGKSCSHIYCPFKCGAYFHQCKAEDHATLCPNVKTECISSSLGCQAVMRRALCISHLQQCPAHVVICGQSIARDDYEKHSCDAYNHTCEPMAGVWSDQWQAKSEGRETQDQPDGQGSAEQPTGEKKKGEKKEGDETEGAEMGSKEESKSPSMPQDPLNTVPWQLEEQPEDQEGEGQVQDENPPPLSPLPDEPEGLTSLPYSILQEIGLNLDRETLHELALTSHYLRQVAASLLRKKGLVETRWKREDGKWMENGRIWRYVPAHLKPDT